MKKIYEKSELAFALIMIAVYCVLQSLANALNAVIGIEYSANALFNIVLTVLLFCFIKKNDSLERYGLCKPTIPARRFLWYVPLLILASHNLWNGAAVNFPLSGTLCYICHMLCVGFVEEVLFRGFLFKAIAKDSLKQAIVISSVTFGLGHLLNLVNGRGMGLVENLCQVCGAIAIGFLFVLIFERSGSLIPCILTHSAIDVVSAFANEAGLTDGKRILLSLSLLAIVLLYILLLIKTLPEKRQPDAAGAPGSTGQL